MNDELQADADNENSEAKEPIESGADLATAAEDNQSKNNDGAQKAINKQHAKFREQERRADGLDKQLAEANEKLAAVEAEKGDVTIPPIPDPFDENYEDKIKARDDAIKHKATQDAQNKSSVEKQNADIEAAKEKDGQRIKTLTENYDSQIVKLGLNAEDVQRAGNTVIEYGIYSDVVEHILQQEDGPLITQYLAANPIVLDELRNLTPIQAALKVNSDIREAASLLRPQASNAPDPAETLTGRGAGEVKSPLISGATFE